MSLRRQLCLNTSLSRREALISQVTKTVGHLYHSHVVWTISCGTACGEFLFIWEPPIFNGSVLSGCYCWSELHFSVFPISIMIVYVFRYHESNHLRLFFGNSWCALFFRRTLSLGFRVSFRNLLFFPPSEILLWDWVKSRQELLLWLRSESEVPHVLPGVSAEHPSKPQTFWVVRQRAGLLV